MPLVPVDVHVPPDEAKGVGPRARRGGVERDGRLQAQHQQRSRKGSGRERRRRTLTTLWPRW